jgi:hypothetical protein
VVASSETDSESSGRLRKTSVIASSETDSESSPQTGSKKVRTVFVEVSPPF